MAGRDPKPWFWKARGEWMVTIKGERHRLGADKDSADKKFHLLMAGEAPEPKEQGRDWLFVSEVVDEFQLFLQSERSEGTLDWYCQYLDPFKEQFMVDRADQLMANSVRNWVNEKWKTQPSRRAAQRAVKAAFRKAVTDGRLPYSTVAAMSLPAETAREHVVSPKEYAGVLAAITDKTFSDLIRFIWLTGARAQEALVMEWSHVDLKNGRIVLPTSKAKGKKKPRVIYLSLEALKLVKTKKGEGKLFKRKNGMPYEKDYVRQLFRKLEPTLKFRFCLTHFRHAFAHRSLAAGNDALTVATLLGHSGTQTLSRVHPKSNSLDLVVMKDLSQQSRWDLRHDFLGEQSDDCLTFLYDLLSPS